MRPVTRDAARSRRTCCSSRPRSLYALFIVYPIFRQFDISFYNWHIFPGAPNPFVGFANYSRVFHDPEIRTAAINTLLFTVITVPVQMVLGLIAAALLTDRLPGRGLLRA